MIRQLVPAILILLAACAPPANKVAPDAIAPVEPVTLPEAEPSAGNEAVILMEDSAVARCAPSDDGIGGTGCPDL